MLCFFRYPELCKVLYSGKAWVFPSVHRLKFAREHLDWSKDWRKVVWSSESPFELFHLPNRDNDRVWEASSSDVPTVPSVKHPANIHVWGMFNCRALSQLHVVPQKTTINGERYRKNIT